MFHLLLIWVVSATCSPRQLAWAGAVSSSCIVAGLVLSGPAAFASWVHLIRRGVVIVTIWLIVYYSRRHSATAERERKALLAQHELELKALRGIIPICAWCKRIRTDSGAWQQIEAYIRDHSEADFSHGICAECLAKLNDQRPASPP
jgi:hypothetical protein